MNQLLTENITGSFTLLWSHEHTYLSVFSFCTSTTYLRVQYIIVHNLPSFIIAPDNSSNRNNFFNFYFDLKKLNTSLKNQKIKLFKNNLT